MNFESKMQVTNGGSFIGLTMMPLSSRKSSRSDHALRRAMFFSDAGTDTSNMIHLTDERATMDSKKRAQLERAGWKVGTVQEFLKLSDEDAAYVEIKARLATSLSQRRAKKRFTQEKVARLLRSSQSRVAKMEAADSSVSLDLLVRSLLALGASPHDVAQAIRQDTAPTNQGRG